MPSQSSQKGPASKSFSLCETAGVLHKVQRVIHLPSPTKATCLVELPKPNMLPTTSSKLCGDTETDVCAGRAGSARWGWMGLSVPSCLVAEGGQDVGRDPKASSCAMLGALCPLPATHHGAPKDHRDPLHSYGTKAGGAWGTGGPCLAWGLARSQSDRWWSPPTPPPHPSSPRSPSPPLVQFAPGLRAVVSHGFSFPMEEAGRAGADKRAAELRERRAGRWGRAGGRRAGEIAFSWLPALNKSDTSSGCE